MSRSIARTLLILLGVALILSGAVYLVHEQFTTEIVGANDFYPRWKGTRLFWEEGINPYSEQATLAIQQDMYGRPALPHEDQVAFAYPFYTVFLLLPLAAPNLSYDWVQAIWLMAVLVTLALAIVVSLRLISWEMPPWLLAITLLWAILFYNSIRAIILGQFAAHVFLALVGCLLALRRQRYRLAGALLVLTTIKPQISFLFIPTLLIWAVARRRWAFLGSFTATAALLAGASFALQPSWLVDFAGQIVNYADYTSTGSPLWIVTNEYLPQLGRPVEIGASLLLFLCLLYTWRRLPSAPAESTTFLAIISVTLLITSLIAPRTATTNQIVLYLPVLWTLKLVIERMNGGHFLAGLFFVTSLAGFWIIFLATHGGVGESKIMYLLLPLVAALSIAGGHLTTAQPIIPLAAPESD